MSSLYLVKAGGGRHTYFTAEQVSMLRAPEVGGFGANVARVCWRCSREVPEGNFCDQCGAPHFRPSGYCHKLVLPQ